MRFGFVQIPSYTLGANSRVTNWSRDSQGIVLGMYDEAIRWIQTTLALARANPSAAAGLMFYSDVGQIDDIPSTVGDAEAVIGQTARGQRLTPGLEALLAQAQQKRNEAAGFVASSTQWKLYEAQAQNFYSLMSINIARLRTAIKKEEEESSGGYSEAPPQTQSGGQNQSRPEQNSSQPSAADIAAQKKKDADKAKADAAKKKAEEAKKKAEKAAAEARARGDAAGAAKAEAAAKKADETLKDIDKGVLPPEENSPIKMLLMVGAAYLLYKAYQSSQEDGPRPYHVPRAPSRERYLF